MLNRIKQVYDGAVGGAAISLASSQAKAAGVGLSIENVSKCTKLLNKIAAGIVLSYFLLIFYVLTNGFGRLIISEELLMKENYPKLQEMVAMCKGNLLDKEQCAEAKSAATKIYMSAPK